MCACLTCFALLLRVKVHCDGEDEHDDGEVDAEFKHLPLEEQVEVSIRTAVQDLVRHLQLVHYGHEHSFENREGLCLGIQPSLVHLLDVDIFVNWQLGYKEEICHSLSLSSFKTTRSDEVYSL